MLLLRHDATETPIDINQGRIPFEFLAVKRAKMKRRGGVNVPIPTPEDLIVMKAIAHRPKDLEDIRGIVGSQPRLDVEYIRKYVEKFGEALDMPELWKNVAALLKRPPSTRKGKAGWTEKK